MSEIDTKIQLISQVKLVPEDNLSTPAYCYTRLQDIIDEGMRSTFGMREKDSMILRLTRDLLTALELAAKSDELERKLKGEQLSKGRLQKSAKEAGKLNAELNDKLIELQAERDALSEDLGNLQAELDRAAYPEVE